MALNRTKNIPLSPDIDLITKIDISTSGITYVGNALPGTTDTEQSWQIQRITNNSTDIVITYAKGTPLFDKQWSLRASYTYV